MDISAAIEAVTKNTPDNELNLILDEVQNLELDEFEIAIRAIVPKAQRQIFHPIFESEKLLKMLRSRSEEEAKFKFDSPVDAAWVIRNYHHHEPNNYFPQHQCFPRKESECRIRRGNICGDCRAELPQTVLFAVSLLNNGKDLSFLYSWNYASSYYDSYQA